MWIQAENYAHALERMSNVQSPLSADFEAFVQKMLRLSRGFSLMKRRLTILLALVATACEASPDERPAVAPAAQGTAARSTVQETAALGPKACALLSADEVAAVTDVAFEAGVVAHDYAGSSQCRFDHHDGTQGIMFTVHTHGDIENYRKVPGSEEVAGLGQAAVWNEGTDQLAVRVGDVVFSISFLTTPSRRQWAVRIAEQIVLKLKS